MTRVRRSRLVACSSTPHHLANAKLVCTAVALAALLVAGPLGCVYHTQPGPLVIAGHSASHGFQPLQAGVASVIFTPEAGYPLAGYGGRSRRQDWPFYFGLGWPGRLAIDLHQWANGTDPVERADMLSGARGTLDPLRARALVLEAGPVAIAMVRVDMVVGSDLLHDAVAERVADLGFEKQGVLIAATHTHSGVGGYLHARMAKLAGTDNYRQEIFERLANACTKAIRTAYAQRQPATVHVGQTRDRDAMGQVVLAENRRHRFDDSVDPNDVDDCVALMCVRSAGSHQLLALLINYAVHPTVLSYDNLLYSADVVGVVEQAVEERLETPSHRPAVLFFNGAQGDIGPRGGYAKPAAMRTLGQRFGELVAGAVPVAKGSANVRLTASYGERFFGTPYGLVVAGSRRRFDHADRSAWQRWLGTALGSPFTAVLWALGLDQTRVTLHPHAGIGVVADLSAYGRTNTYRFHAVRIDTTDDHSAVLLTAPGELTHALGEALKDEALARGATTAFILGLTNGAMAYVADRETYFAGGYEATGTLYGPGTGERVLSSLRACMAEVGLHARWRRPAPR